MVNTFDYNLFHAINRLAETAAFWNPVMKFLAQDGEYLFYLAVVVYWFLRTGSNRRMVAESLISACVGLGLSGVISSFFYRSRPFVTDQVIQLIKHAPNASFPSDHAVGAFVIATAIWFFRRRDGWVWLAFAACIAFSRVWVGVHYPTDVAAGALLGIASAAAVHRIFAHWSPARRVLQGGIAVYEKLENRVWVRK